MKLSEISTADGKRKFLRFRENLYKGDPCYVCTEKFVFRSVLYDETDFIKKCMKVPVQVCEGEEILAQAILIYNSALPYVQISFFDALPDCKAAADMIISRASELKKEVGAEGIIAGLNAHLSYGVGILVEGFDKKISFDSQYNKSYYGEYFKEYPKDTLCTYKGRTDSVSANFPLLNANKMRVRFCRLSDFRREMELMRSLCERTIAHTNLYFPTEPLHFYQLTKALKPFLKAENLLFAEDEKGNAAGFLFWHPDFNQMLKGGRNYSLAGIALSKLFNSKKLQTAKVNALGSLSYSATFALINAFRQLAEGRYPYVETNFVWDNNVKSALLMKRLFGYYDRKYEVYYIR